MTTNQTDSAVPLEKWREEYERLQVHFSTRLSKANANWPNASGAGRGGLRGAVLRARATLDAHVDALLSRVAKLERERDALRDVRDGLIEHIGTMNDRIAELESRVLPEIECPLCKGIGQKEVTSFVDSSKTISKSCSACRGRGRIGNGVVLPEDARDIIARVIAADKTWVNHNRPLAADRKLADRILQALEEGK